MVEIPFCCQLQEDAKAVGRQVEPTRLFYEFRLDDHVPADHLLRRIDRFLDLESLRYELKPSHSNIGRPRSIRN